MILGDIVPAAVLFAIGLLVLAQRKKFVEFSTQFTWFAAGLKFMILATIGSQIKLRIATGEYVPEVVWAQQLSWFLTGAVIYLAFRFFSRLADLIAPKLTGWKKSLLKSLLINVVFAWAMMIGHMELENFLLEGGFVNPDLTAGTMWGLGGFIMWTILLFWIPAHTVTFSLPKGWQMLFAATLSIALGLFTAGQGVMTWNLAFIILGAEGMFVGTGLEIANARKGRDSDAVRDKRYYQETAILWIMVALIGVCLLLGGIMQ